MASSSSSSRNWVYDVFVSFRGEDVRKNFLGHFLKELDQKLIKTFIDNEMGKGQSIDFMLKKAIRTSRIAVVLFSENYASSSWCLDELVEIVKCKEELDQVVIPIFYGLDPSDVRKQTGKFGEAFAMTCEKKSENETKVWQKSLVEVANLCGNHSQNWANEAKMVEEIVNDVLDKILNLIPQKEFGNFVGMENHIAKMNELLRLESEEVRMVGIWGSSGIGKTSIARALYSEVSHRFQRSVFIDKSFVFDVMKKYENFNPYDPNVKLQLAGSFLSEILGKKDIKVDSFDTMRQMLKHHKVSIFIDDLDHQEVLETLVGQSQWFGCGSRIIVITKDKHFLRAQSIDHIYEVCLPSDELALKIFCKSAFGEYSPPHGLMEFASKITLSAGNLPLGLHVLGSYVKGVEKELLTDMLPYLQNRLNGEIEKTLKLSYDGLNSPEDKTIFRHIACLFNGERVEDIELLLRDSNLYVNIGLRNLVDKALIHIRDGIVEIHSLLQKMGKEIVRAQSNKPSEREFLVDAKDICDLLKNNVDTNKILGIALDMDELHIHELRIHENAFENMPNLLFLKVYTKHWYQKRLTAKWDKEKEVKWHLPQKLRFLRLDGYPKKCMPSRFCPENLVILEMRKTKLERLWEGVQTLGGLKKIDLSQSIYLKEIPDLSKATNLEKLNLVCCSSLVELPSSIKHLNKLENLVMTGCDSLETLPNGINLQSLQRLELFECPRLNSFPDISTNISVLFLGQSDIVKCHTFYSNLRRSTSETLWTRAQPYSLKTLILSDISSLVEFPSSIQNFIQLRELCIYDCINLETIPTGIHFCFLSFVSFSGCLKLRSFPNISTNIEELCLQRTGIEEVPWWIVNFTKLRNISMEKCNSLVCVSLNIYYLKYLEKADFSDCGKLSEASWNGIPIAIEEVLTHRSLQLRFVNLDPETILQNRSIIFNSMVLSGEEVPSYFTYQTTGFSLTNICLPPTTLSQKLFKFRACVLIVFDSAPKYGYDEYYVGCHDGDMDIHVRCRFKDRLRNSFDVKCQNHVFSRVWMDSALYVLDYVIPPDKYNGPLAKLVSVDMEIHVLPIGVEKDYVKYTLKGWGIKLFEECSSPMNGFSSPYKVPHFCEDNLVSESEHSDEDNSEYSNPHLREDNFVSESEDGKDDEEYIMDFWDFNG